MQHFSFIVKNPLGMHARPAGLLVKKNMEFKSAVTVRKGDATADGKRLFSVMGLGIRQGDKVQIEVEGPDENEACLQIREIAENLFGQGDIADE